MNDFGLALIPLNYIRQAEGGATTITLAEMAIRNADLVKKYFYFVLDNWVWARRDLSSMEEFRQAVENMKTRSRNRVLLAKLVEEQASVLSALVNQSLVSQLWESL